MKQSAESKVNGEKSMCVSVFKSGENISTKGQFTKVWVDLINRVEKGKDKSAPNC